MKSLPTPSPKRARSTAILADLVTYLRIHGPTKAAELSAAVGCGLSTLTSSKVIQFNDALLNQQSDWRLRCQSAPSARGSKELTWSVIPKPVRVP
jgi:hypothetical protein